MAYADKPQMSNSRIAAIVIVALLHALLGYAFVTGLAYNVVKKVAEDLKTFNVEEEPPPPEDVPPPPPKEIPQTPPPVVAPPPIVRTNPQPQVIQVVREADPPQITVKADPQPQYRACPDGSSVEVSRPCPVVKKEEPKKVEPAKARANLPSLFSDEDYPASAIRSGESGTTGFSLEIGPNGRVTNCTITSSSGSSSLDATTCRLLKSRARFTPARDSAGNATSDTVRSRIVWRLPAD